MEEVRKKRRSRLSEGFVIIVGVIVFTVPTVLGGFIYTNVASPPSGEKNHARILGEDIYGGTFTKSGLNYSNGTITANRVYDHDDETIFTLNLLTQTLVSEVDQIWTDGTATVTAKAKYASLSQSFGWNGGGTGTTYIPLLTHADIPTQREVDLEIDGDFLWGYHPDGYQWWSLNGNNSDGKDHFVTYKIEGLGGSGVTWLIFMEDLPLSQADRDYNDFVVEITAIPEPATICLLAIGALLLRKRS
jgi:hypothetical protein